MQYLLLIYHKESEWETLTEAERQRLYGGYRSLREELMNKGNWIGGNQLQPVVEDAHDPAVPADPHTPR